MEQTAELHFAGDHATAAGHFPGNPIIPGALLLDAAVDAITTSVGKDGTILIRSTKFFRQVRPGDCIRLRWRVLASGAITFDCLLVEDDALAATGTIEISRMPR